MSTSTQWVNWGSKRAPVEGQRYTLPRVRRQMTDRPHTVDSGTKGPVGRLPLHEASQSPHRSQRPSRRQRSASLPSNCRPTTIPHETNVVQCHDNPSHVHNLQPCGPSSHPRHVLSSSPHSRHPPAGEGCGGGLSRRSSEQPSVLLSPSRYLQDGPHLSHSQWLAGREKHSTHEPSSYRLHRKEQARLSGTTHRIKDEQMAWLLTARQNGHESQVSGKPEKIAARLPEALSPCASQLAYTSASGYHQESQWQLTPELRAKDAAEELRCVRKMQATLHHRRCRMMHLRQVYKVGAGRAWKVQPPVVWLVCGCGRACRRVLAGLQLPNSFLNHIGGRYGASGVAVFNLMKDLIQLNLVLSLVLWSWLVAPALYQTHAQGQPMASTNGWITQHDPPTGDRCPPVMTTYDNPKVVNCSTIYLGLQGSENSTHRWNQTWWVSELLLGEGRLEHSLLFLGNYPVMMLEDTYPTGAAQLLAVVAVFLASLVMVVSRIGQWLRYNSTVWGGPAFSKMVFTGWDFSLRNKHCIRSKRRILTTKIRAALDEHDFQRAKSERTHGQLMGLYVTRVAVNCVILVAVSLGCIIIIVVTNYRQIIEEYVDDLPLQEMWQRETLKFMVSYLDTLTVWLLGLLLPPVFSSLGSLEQFSSRVTMLLFILRSACVRLVSLGVLVASNLILVTSDITDDCRPDVPCWETTLAQNLYSQVVWDFAMRVVTTVFLLGHKLLIQPFSCKKSLVEFDVPSRVLDILSLQTILWLSVSVSPLLPVLVLVSMYLMLWLEVLVALLITKPSRHVFQVSQSSAMFMVVLAVSWVGAAAMTVVVFVFIRPSLGCGPFRGLTVSWDALTHYICNLHGSMNWLGNIFSVLDNLQVMVCVGMLLLLAAFYYLFLLQLRLAVISRLEEQLKEISQEKIYLMERHKKLCGYHRPAPTTKTDIDYGLGEDNV